VHATVFNEESDLSHVIFVVYDGGQTEKSGVGDLNRTGNFSLEVRRRVRKSRSSGRSRDRWRRRRRWRWRRWSLCFKVDVDVYERLIVYTHSVNRLSKIRQT